MQTSRPRIGDTVHYRSYGTPGGEFTPECRAAIVTATGEGDNLWLAVLNPTGLFFNGPIPQADNVRNAEGGTWHHRCVQ